MVGVIKQNCMVLFGMQIEAFKHFPMVAPSLVVSNHVIYWMPIMSNISHRVLMVFQNKGQYFFLQFRLKRQAVLMNMAGTKTGTHLLA